MLSVSVIIEFFVNCAYTTWPTLFLTMHYVQNSFQAKHMNTAYLLSLWLSLN